MAVKSSGFDLHTEHDVLVIVPPICCVSKSLFFTRCLKHRVITHCISLRSGKLRAPFYTLLFKFAFSLPIFFLSVSVRSCLFTVSAFSRRPDKLAALKQILSPTLPFQNVLLTLQPGNIKPQSNHFCSVELDVYLSHLSFACRQQAPLS